MDLNKWWIARIVLAEVRHVGARGTGACVDARCRQVDAEPTERRRGLVAQHEIFVVPWT